MSKAAITEFRNEVATKLKAAIDAKGLPLHKAAEQLNISRQSLHRYLNRLATPRSNVLYLACTKWGVQININGMSFNPDAFEASSKKKQPHLVVPLQLPLPLAISQLRDECLQVKVVRRSDESVELHVKINFGT